MDKSKMLNAGIELLEQELKRIDEELTPLNEEAVTVDERLRANSATHERTVKNVLEVIRNTGKCDGEVAQAFITADVAHAIDSGIRASLSEKRNSLYNRRESIEASIGALRTAQSRYF